MLLCVNGPVNRDPNEQPSVLNSRRGRIVLHLDATANVRGAGEMAGREERGLGRGVGRIHTRRFPPWIASDAINGNLHTVRVATT